MRNGRSPAGFKPNGLPRGRQSRCRLAVFEPAKVKDGWMGLDACGVAGMDRIKALICTHAKQQIPSRIQAQRVATWSAEPVPFSSFEPANKNKAGWMGLDACSVAGMDRIKALICTHAKRQIPSRIQAQRVATWSAEPVPFSSFEPAKVKDGWMGLDACGVAGMERIKALICTHAKRQIPSRIQAQRVATWSAEPVPFRSFEPAKVKDGWMGLDACSVAGMDRIKALICTHAKRQIPSRIQAQRVATWSAEPVPFSSFEPAKVKDGWMGLDACGVAGMERIKALICTHAKRQIPSRIQAQRVATWSAEPVPFRSFEPAKVKDGWMGLDACGVGWDGPNKSLDLHACETAEPQQDSSPTGCHVVGRAGAV